MGRVPEGCEEVIACCRQDEVYQRGDVTNVEDGASFLMAVRRTARKEGDTKTSDGGGANFMPAVELYPRTIF